MPTNNNLSRALVLSGGGVTGIAWELGILTALQRGGVDVTNADLVVGTSAGSVVGAQITSGKSLDELFAAQIQPPEQSGERATEFDLGRFQQMIMTAIQEAGMNPPAVRASIGKQALAAQTLPETERLEIIMSRLPFQNWPASRLLITAVDAEDGEFKVFDRESGVPLVSAVAASCAVPLVWPPVSINGRRYVDGGMRSGSNADLAKGYAKVLLLTPFPPVDQFNMAAYLGSDLKQEIALLEKEGSRVKTIIANEAALKAFGTNVLNPANRAAAANAGLEQGQTLVEEIRQFWLAS
jgi:NTE family protein